MQNQSINWYFCVTFSWVLVFGKFFCTSFVHWKHCETICSVILNVSCYFNIGCCVLAHVFIKWVAFWKKNIWNFGWCFWLLDNFTRHWPCVSQEARSSASPLCKKNCFSFHWKIYLLIEGKKKQNYAKTWNVDKKAIARSEHWTALLN